jgi:hypothetical protein
MSDLHHGTIQISLSRMYFPKYDTVGQCDASWLLTNDSTACSLQCSRDHKGQCAGRSDFPANPIANDDSSNEKVTVAGSIRYPATHTLTDAPEFRNLFTLYPGLRGLLRGIYEASQPPLHNHSANGTYRDHQPCSQDVHDHQPPTQKGLESALRKLSWHLDSAAAESNGVAEMCETVSKLLRDKSLHS